MKKSTQKRISRLTALFLTLLMLAVPLFSVFADGTTIPARVSSIYDNQVYMLKNKASGLYLTLPDYTETGRNVYQYSKRVNDQYSRAVTITYSPTNGLYTINALIYEDFGGGRVTFDVDGNVYLSQDSNGGSGEWRFCYNGEQQGFRILNQNLEAITSSFGHGSASQDIGSAGNIYVSSEQLGNYQIWELEAVTVNPHLVKATTTIEKKNIGNANEWLFRLRDAELDTRTIESVEVVMNPEIVTVVFNTNFNNKGFIVRVTEANDVENDPHEKYSLIKVTLNWNEIRYVMVQDAGTGSNDACKTVPIYKYSRYSTVTIPENGTKDYMVTLTSEIGGKPVKRWEISDDWVITTKTHDGKLLSGTSYIVVKASNIGFSLISAYIDHDSDSSTEDIAYSVLVEVVKNTGNNIETHQNVISMYDLYIEQQDMLENDLDNTITDSDIRYSLRYNQVYLIKTDWLISSLTATDNLDLSLAWNLNGNYATNVIAYGDNYLLFETPSMNDYAEQEIITSKKYFINDISVLYSSTRINASFKFDKADRFCINNGVYVLQNMEDTDCYLQQKSGNSNDVEVGEFDGNTSERWWIEYIGNGYYKIALESNHNKALCVSGDSNESVSINDYNGDSKFQWQISYMAYKNDNDQYEWSYTIRNRATLETRMLSAKSGLPISDRDVLNRTQQYQSRADEWRIWKSDLSAGYSNEECITKYGIGYWENSPTVSIQITRNNLSSPNISNNQYTEAMEYAVTAWEQALNIDITIVDTNSDITIYVTDISEYKTKIPEQDREHVTVDSAGFTYPEFYNVSHKKMNDDVIVKVQQLKKAKIGIFRHDDLNLIKSVIIHELGHALGYFSHTNNNTDVMYLYNSYVIFDGDELTYNDTNTISELYSECYLGD